MSQKQKIHILGGGPAGLSVGYYGKKKGKSISIHESSKYCNMERYNLESGLF